jgi:Flp pilus assembly protein TadD
MAHTIQSESGPEIPRKRITNMSAGVMAMVLVLGSSAALVTWRASPRVSVHQSDTGSPYKNTRVGVKYLGDAACIRCHGEIAETYRQHPMGRSLSPIASAPPPGNDSESKRPLFKARGFEYAIEHRDGRVIHQEMRRDASGRIIARNEAEVQFVLGSGSQGLSYLIERDGFLFQSPISWYAQKRRWDLSPGYEKRNPHFERGVVPACLSCHANRVEPVPGTINRYQPPIFQGHAIGCERCHGPGEVHVRRPELVDGRDLSIVNPANLEPSLRDAVCEQCHLIGHHRVVRVDHQEEDYRPGLPFQHFWTVFEQPAGLAKNRFVGQVEQMHESRCFVASRGRLGCITCHDPHRLPSPEEKATYFRTRCLNCHTDRGCSLSATVRLEGNRADDCVSCHMPRLSSSEIIHSAATNHRIPRHMDGRDRSPIHLGGTRPGRRLLVSFHDDLLSDQERAETERDIGVAICRDGSSGAAAALPLLEAALAACPNDVPAWEAKGIALGRLGRGKEALAAFRTALTKEPIRESTLQEAALLAAQVGLRADAIAYWQRAITINPWRADYLAELAPLYFQGREWHAATQACRNALRLNPAELDVRKLLVRCYLRLSDPRAARREFESLLDFDPPDKEELIRWFAPLSRPD